MHRTESDNNIEVGGLKLYSNGPPGTTLDAVDRNTLQEEIAYVIEQAGLTLKTESTETNEQLKAAISLLIASETPEAIKATDWSSKNLIINHQSDTTVDADADELSFINSSNILAFGSDINVTFNTVTDTLGGLALKPSHWYQMWLDSTGVKILAPDLFGEDDGADDNKLIDGGADFVTDLVQVGDIVYNLTDISSAIVSAIDNLTTLSLTPITPGFVMQNGDEYKIRMLSPPGLGAFKARIGAAFSNSSSDFDDTTYTQIQEEKTYLGDGVNFSISGTPTVNSVSLSIGRVRQILDWTGLGSWMFQFNINTSITSDAIDTADIEITGILFAGNTLGMIGMNNRITAVGPVTSVRTASPNIVRILHLNTTVTGHIFSGDGLLLKKPSFHN